MTIVQTSIPQASEVWETSEIFTADSFKETELGPIPSHWEVVRLGDVFDIQQGKSLSRKKDEGWSPYPFLRTANVYWGRIDLSTVDEMDFTEEEIKKFKLKPGDLLTCEGGDIGRTAIWQLETGIYCYQNHLHRLRPKKQDIDPFFYMYWMQAAFLVLNLYQGEGNKTTIPNLSRSRLSQFWLPKPPFGEQRRIAHILNTIQREIAAQDKLVAAAREVKRSLMQRLFTYGPGAELAPTKETEIGEVPEHWEVVRLREVARIGNGSTPKRTNPAYWQGGTIPWLTSGKVHERIIQQADEFVTELAKEECHLPIVPRGSIVVAITGQGKTLGNAALVTFDTCVNQHLAYVQFRDSHIVPEFVLAFLQQQYEDLRQASQAGGSTKGALTCGFLMNYLIPQPPVEEQCEIARIISAADRKIAAEEQRKSALQALFKSLLHQLMTGQVRVKETSEGRTQMRRI